ncbi:Multidrug resistance-associated protein 4 [Clydaea vesicula]|uniref:Multidrug resistance-associated protein 4 n=1 Tax=Clydaea vesicula TaxID=447962 RepID=A0AAD5XZB8_9FUNG|nr:Multidrug resistance-associated protein 4 [Clydaea vesicula]
MRQGIRFRVCFSSLIYGKMLKLSSGHASSTGKIVNLISNDVQRLEDVSLFVPFLFTAPIDIILSTLYLYFQIGYSALFALLALFLFVLVQSYLGKKFGSIRSHTVKHRDDRVRTISDMIAGILVVKLYAWENPFKTKVEIDRKKEMHFIKNSAILKALNLTLAFAATTIISVFPLLSFFLMGGFFTPSVIFSVISIISNLQMFLTFFFANAIMNGSEALVSIQRIKEFLLLNEVTNKKLMINLQEDKDLIRNNIFCKIYNNASFKWSNDSASETILSDINFEIKGGELLGVCGPVGSGKSSLACALLGEMECASGNYFLRKSLDEAGEKSLKVAYCSQVPWIVAEKTWFNTVIQICELVEDINSFPDGADTLIGERGVMLSGGQKARLGLARAVYADADFYILDDPLSAVDAKVGKKLFENCIKSLLINSKSTDYGNYRKTPATVVLITHQLHFLPRCERVLVLINGRIESLGSFNDAIINNINNNEFIESMKNFNSTELENIEEIKTFDSAESISNETIQNNSEVVLSTPHCGKEGDLIFDNSADLDTKKELNEEVIKQGVVTFSTYLNYFKSGVSILHVIFIFALLILGVAASMITDWWISRWTSQNIFEQRNNGTFNASFYVSLAVLSVLISIFRAMFFFYVCLTCSKHLFLKMLQSVSRSPLNFFELNPHGRLLNRFSKDLSTVDEMLPITIYDFTSACGYVVGSLILACIYIPFLLILIPFTVFVFLRIRTKYIASSRQIKRLDSASRSPIYSTVPTTLEGLITLRAFGKGDWFKLYFDNLQNENTKFMSAFISSSRWLGIRLDWVVGTFLLAITAMSIVMKNLNLIQPASVGLVLTYAFSMLGTLQWAVRQSAEVENQMISVERILEYTNLPSEAKEVTDVKLPPDWPNQGDVSINHLSLQYPGSTKKVLKDISIHFAPGEKIAIVGRTGAGKSSLLQALFRLVEPTSGNFVIDGFDLSTLGLRDLRSRISIIPQEPFCFKGTLRFNIDPFAMYSDKQLWDALASVEMKNMVENLDLKLDSEVSEGGSNWSVGERQLICLTRAILRNTRLIVMDEPTSNIDNHTDSLIQHAIRSESGLFANSTVITIAHRLNTVIDFDKIMVLDDGKVVEFGNPHELLSKTDETAWFNSMIQELGEEAENSLRKIAKERFEIKKL